MKEIKRFEAHMIPAYTVWDKLEGKYLNKIVDSVEEVNKITEELNEKEKEYRKNGGYNKSKKYKTEI